MFSQSVVTSVLSYAVVCWERRVTKEDLSSLEKLIELTSLVVGPSGKVDREDNSGQTARHHEQCLLPTGTNNQRSLRSQTSQFVSPGAGPAG